MDIDYMILADGTKVRVLFNMNAVDLFTRDSGKDLPDLANLKTDVAIFRKLAYACITEGEAADGRSFDLTEIELGRKMTVLNMTEFSNIIARQGSGVKKKAQQNKSWWQRKR